MWGLGLSDQQKQHSKNKIRDTHYHIESMTQVCGRLLHGAREIIPQQTGKTLTTAVLTRLSILQVELFLGENVRDANAISQTNGPMCPTSWHEEQIPGVLYAALHLRRALCSL